MNVRVATRTDLPGIRDVADRSLAASYDDVLDAETRQQAVEAWYGTDHTSPGALTDEIEDERTVVVVAEDGDNGVAGFAQAYLTGDDPRVGQIEWLHVRPSRRGEGIADRLLDAIESALTERGADRIESQVIEANAEGQAFYEDHGYNPARTRQVLIADEQEVTELTLTAEDLTTTDAALTDRMETDDGETILVAYDESERGTEGPFYATYLEVGDREHGERWGWYCSVCDSLDVNMSTMGEMVCDNCGNERLATRWDATYGG